MTVLKQIKYAKGAMLESIHARLDGIKATGGTLRSLGQGSADRGQDNA